MTAIQPIVKTGKFPHDAFLPNCACPEGQAKETKNYAGHVVAPPRCSACGKPYQLEISLMSTYQPKQQR